MKSDFLIALTRLATERGMTSEMVVGAIEAALASAYKRDNLAASQNISVRLNPGNGDIRVYVLKNVVGDVEDNKIEMTRAEAEKIKPNAEIGDVIEIESTHNLSERIVAETAKQMVMQRLREAERELVFEEYSDRSEDVVTGSHPPIRKGRSLIRSRQETAPPLHDQSDKQTMTLFTATSIPELIEHLYDESVNIRLQAIGLLGSVNDPRVVPVLCRVLQKDTSFAARMAAADALAKLGDPASLESLSSAQLDSSKRVRESATSALRRIQVQDTAFYLDWIVLPEGWRQINNIANTLKREMRDQNQGMLFWERLEFIEMFNPERRYVSQSRFGGERYWVFLFKNHVVAECPAWGNALYVIYGTDDWTKLLRLPKRELLTRYKSRARRIIHKGDWKRRMGRILKTA